MCTALGLNCPDHYFGRNLDLHCSYGEKVCVTPRNFPLTYRKVDAMDRHYAMIGMAMDTPAMPLYYEAVNEKGLCMAGLNFPGNAVYHPEAEGKDNLTPFEFIPWILGQCATLAEAREKLERLNLVNIPFAPSLPLSPLHWIISSAEGAITVESMADGLHVWENPVGVLSNNPPFPHHIANLRNYRQLSAATPPQTFPGEALGIYCQGLGGLGLPGDLSSMSRFVRMAFHGGNSVCDPEETSAVGQFFHLLTSVAMPKGSCLTDEGHWDITVYSCCVHAPSGRYYYTTYDNRQITCVDMRKTDLDSTAVSVFDLRREQAIFREN